jgi:hypothetical protein
MTDCTLITQEIDRDGFGYYHKGRKDKKIGMNYVSCIHVLTYNNAELIFAE